MVLYSMKNGIGVITNDRISSIETRVNSIEQLTGLRAQYAQSIVNLQEEIKTLDAHILALRNLGVPEKAVNGVQGGISVKED